MHSFPTLSVTLLAAAATITACAATEQDLGNLNGAQGGNAADAGDAGAATADATPPPPNRDGGVPPQNDASTPGPIPSGWNQPAGSTRCAYGPEDLKFKNFTYINFSKSDYRAWCFPNDDVVVEWKLFSVSSSGKLLDLNDKSDLTPANVYVTDYSNNDPGDLTGTRVPVKFNTCTVQSSAAVIAPLPASPVDIYARCSWRLVTNISRPGFHDVSLTLRAGFPDGNGNINPAWDLTSLDRIGWGF